MSRISRRNLIATGPAALAAGAFLGEAVKAEASPPPGPDAIQFCLNTSTISGQKLPIAKVLEIAARAGYSAVEPWIRELDEHVAGGGSLDDLGKKAQDLGLAIPSAIGFFDWVVDDPSKRAKALEQARKDMEKVRKIGGTRIAAPPTGATDRADLDLRRIAERYRALLEIGDAEKVVPQVEVWGFSKTLGKLSDAVFVAMESDHPSACVLGDVYHFYKGGSVLEGLHLLGPDAMFVIHANDYPENPPRSEITDAQRVYPGDGVAPYPKILGILRKIGFRGYLSLELFHREYWKQDPEAVARTGLAKMKAVTGLGPG